LNGITEEKSLFLACVFSATRRIIKMRPRGPKKQGEKGLEPAIMLNTLWGKGRREKQKSPNKIDPQSRTTRIQRIKEMGTTVRVI